MQKRRKKTSKEERVCPVCSKEFSKAEHLFRHIRSHTKERPFQCSECNKAYARQDTLLRHSRSHQTRASEEHPQISVAIDDVVVADAPSVRRDGAAIASADTGPVFETFGIPAGPHRSYGEEVLSLQNSGSVEDTGTLDTIITSTIPMSTSLEAGTAATTASLPSTGQEGVRQSDLMPYWSLEGEPQWQLNPFLGGNYLDFDALDLSFLNPVTRHPGDTMATDESSPHAANATHSVSGFTYGSGSIARSDCLVQQSWHTFCGEAPSGYATPDPGQDNYHVDEVCHKTLRDKLRPRPQHDLLPSTSFLDLCVQAYFANFQPIFPIIHAPSFRPHAQNGLLLLSICSIGSLFLGFPRATAQGISMYERLNKAILSSWEAFIVHRGISNHIAIQASVIGQIFALLMGRPKDLAQLEIFHGSLVVSARRMKLHQLSESTDNIAQLSGQELEATWKRWVRREEGRRTLHAIFLQDAEVARLFHVNPIMRQGMDQLPPTCSKEAFAARDAVSWKTVMLLQAVPHSISPPQTAPGVGPNRVQNFPTVLNEFELCVILERVGAAVSESRGPNFPPAQPPLGCQQILTTWYETYQGTGIFKTQESSLMMLWHSICMLLYMDLDMLECAVGREGYEGKQKHHPAARTWAKSLEARKCIAHAILVQRQFEQMQMGTEAPIHAPMCLYRCGIAWYCYMQFGSRGQVVESDAMDMPELELLRIDGKTALIEELEGHVGRSAEGFLLKIVNLLRRITHWKVADSLASTLLSIIEECKDIF